MSCLGGQLCSCFTSSVCFTFKSVSLSSSIATRISYAAIFLLNSLVAFLVTTDWAVKRLEAAAGVVEPVGPPGFFCPYRIPFDLIRFGLGVTDTSHPRASIQNKYWLLKFAVWLLLLGLSFFIPNGFIQFWGSHVALVGAALFILIQLLLLVDFAHTFTETCLDKHERSDDNKWLYVIFGGSASILALSITLTGALYGFFAGSGCSLNRFYISANLGLAATALFCSVHPRVQEENPRSGLLQAGLVVAYCTYLITSAIVNEPTVKGLGHCNPLDHATGTRTTSIVIGGLFTLIAIAYSTSRAATNSTSLMSFSGGPDTALPLDQPSIKSQAIHASVESGSLQPSEVQGGTKGAPEDDETEGVAYSYALFHLVFAIAAMYVALLLTNWNSISSNSDDFISIGRSYPAMWVKVVSSWIGYSLYLWSLVGPIVLPER
ncbi:Membrane protein tms1 [Massospora cicadina]|nr:Membrane protein tms1 [Massospora cicadina]